MNKIFLLFTILLTSASVDAEPALVDDQLKGDFQISLFRSLVNAELRRFPLNDPEDVIGHIYKTQDYFSSHISDVQQSYMECNKSKPRCNLEKVYNASGELRDILSELTQNYTDEVLNNGVLWGDNTKNRILE